MDSVLAVDECSEQPLLPIRCRCYAFDMFAFVRRLLSKSTISEAQTSSEDKIKRKTLNATVSASPYDEHYEMALVYCVDKETGHCFSLTRFPGQDEIEVMVVDQINAKVLDLHVTLTGNCLQATIPEGLARRLDGVEQYSVYLDLPNHERAVLISSLKKIFEGKSGLSLDEA